MLSKFDPDPKNKEVAEKQLRADLSKVIDKYSKELRPGEGSKKYVSADKSFVLVIAASGRNGGGDSAIGDGADAKLVVAVGGNGSPTQAEQTARGGGSAIAKAPSGVAVAIGGNGGAGGGGKGGGGGGASVAIGSIGGITLGGNGGSAGPGQEGGTGACKVGNADAVIKAVKELQKK